MIILGQFIPLNTPIHRIDPRIKLGSTLILLIYIFIISKFEVLGVLFALVILIASLTRIPAIHIIRGLRPIIFLILLTVLIQIFSTKGDPLISFWSITITKQGLFLAAFVVTRLILLVSISVILTFATSPLDLTFAMERFMVPLRAIGFPSSEVALMMSIALRFIPTLLEETDKIIKAQSSRGAEFNSGGVIARSKAFIPVLIPLFISAFRRAEELADAMESRCFKTGGKRSRLHLSKITIIDIVIFISIILVLAGLYVWAAL